MSIARDSVGTRFDYPGSGTTITLAHTCTGTNLMLWAEVYEKGGNLLTGVTYNSVAMTKAGVTVAVGASADNVSQWYLIAPATGTNNIVATFSSAPVDGTVRGASYTGVKQTGQPDATTSTTASSGTSQTTTLNTVADKCWAIVSVRQNADNLVPGTNASSMAASSNSGMFDNSGFGDITPAGTFIFTLTTSISGDWGMSMASFAPAAASTATPRRALLGVGI